MALLLTVATGAWAQDPDPIDLTPSADGTVWTLSTMPEYDVELEVTYYTDEEVAEMEEAAYTAGVDLTDNGDGTWTLAATPGFDVELEVEYKADLTLTVNIEGWTFGATANTPTVSGNEGSGAVTFEYKKKGAADDSYSTDVPTDAGEYTVRATVAETDDYVDGTATADFTIAKAAATISYETASVSKTYGDADFTNDLTNTGNGTVTYTSNNESVATVNSETGLIHIVGSGEATITATVADGTNYTYAVKTAQYAIGVNTAAMSVTATNYTGTYDGDSHTITVTVTEPEGTTVKYGTVEGTYDLDEAPAYTDAGIYSVFYQVTKANYTTVEGSAIVTIDKAAGVISFAESSISKTYGDADFTNTLTNTGDGTVTYTSNNESVATVNSETGLVTITGAPGEATITATVTDGTNYAYATATATFSVGVNSAAITVSAEGFTGTYDSKSHTITVTVTEPEGTTVKYGTTAGEYTLDEAPAYTDAGEYTIYYQVTKANYTTVENSAVVSIQKAAASISYETTAVSKTAGDEAFVNALTMTGDGTVTYSSDNVNVATVNSETGEVTIKGTGNATIKATVVDGTNYTYATKTAQYTLTVEAATGISDVKTDATENANWYDLSGRPLNGKPTKAGVYVKNGKKVVIK